MSDATAHHPTLDLPPELAGHPRYRIVRVLGQGGMGVVYEAEHRHMGRKVALKVIHQNFVDRPEAVERFNREVHAAARLSHPNIVTAFDAEQAGSLHLLVMEYVEGMSLAQVVAKKGPLPVTYACHFVRQAALGLQHAFELGMVHRDIKPHNLMMTPRGQVKILDFGLARLAHEKTAGPGLTAENAVMGTPEYLAPEQALDAHRADIRADIYSLGCTLYCLLAGKPPFPEGTAMQQVMAHLEKEARPLPEIRPEVPAALWAVVRRMLAKEPAARFQKPAEVAQALTPFTKTGMKPTAGAGLEPSVKGASPAAGTLLAGDTGTNLKPGKEASAPDETPAQFGELAPAAVVPKSGTKAHAVGKPKPIIWYQRPGVLAGIGGGVLALALGAWLLAGIFPKTPETTADGTPPVVPADAHPPGNKGDGADQKDAVVATAPAASPGEPSSPTGQTTEAGQTRPGEAPVQAVLADGFAWLFNGKDLTGWQVNEGGNLAVWGVRDGVLYAEGGRGGWLMTEKEYGDFELRLEFKVAAKGNSGVALRSPLAGDPSKVGMEIQILDDEWHKQNLKGLRDNQLTGAIYDVVAPSRNALKPVGEWNTLAIAARGRLVRVTLNDTMVVDADLDDYQGQAAAHPGLLRAKGHLGLQSHDGRVEFRNLQVKELVSASPQPAPTITTSLTETTPDPVAVALKKELAAIEAAMKKAEQKLVAAFAQELELLPRANLKPDERLKRIEALQAEKAAFEQRGRIPWSPRMRPALLEYLKAVREHRTWLDQAFERAIDAYLKRNELEKAKDCRSEKRWALEPKVLAVWHYTWAPGKTGRKKFMSDGTVAGETCKWTVYPDRVVVTAPGNVKGGVWIDTLTRMSADGKVMTGANQLKHPKSARLAEGE